MNQKYPCQLPDNPEYSILRGLKWPFGLDFNVFSVFEDWSEKSDRGVICPLLPHLVSNTAQSGFLVIKSCLFVLVFQNNVLSLPPVFQKIVK